MTERFFISDTHFGHEATCTKFKREDGTPLRPFSSSQEMDEEMVSRWNSVVKSGDVVYHLGDVAIKKQFLPILARLNGSKRLIRGNHDIFPTKVYLQYFKEIYGVRVFVDDFILSHIPLHPDCVGNRFKTNVHGHLHASTLDDPKYISVCVEQINYTPIHWDELKARIQVNKTKHDYVF